MTSKGWSAILAVAFAGVWPGLAMAQTAAEASEPDPMVILTTGEEGAEGDAEEVDEPSGPGAPMEGGYIESNYLLDDLGDDGEGDSASPYWWSERSGEPSMDTLETGGIGEDFDTELVPNCSPYDSEDTGFWLHDSWISPDGVPSF